MRKSIAIVVVLALFAGSANAALLWDNEMTPNGFSGRAISPPNFPDIRVADDFTVDISGRFTIEDFHANVIEDAGWTDGGEITLEIRADSGGQPGDIVGSHTGEYTRMFLDMQYFGRDDYDYWIEGIDISLPDGTYWATIRNASGGGAGTNYWMTSDGGADGPGSSTGFFSLDGGGSWAEEGAGWHHAFQVTGVPEPTTCLLLGLGGLALLRRRN